MQSPGPSINPEPDLEGSRDDSRGVIRRSFANWRRLATIAYRDPTHVAERLTLYGATNLSKPASAWAQRSSTQQTNQSRAVRAEGLRKQSAQIARIDGAISGTPFLIAFVPAYLAYLWQEGRMVLYTAALYGRDPAAIETSAEVLVLRGVHPTVEAAHAALVAVKNTPLPERPTHRRPLAAWVHSIHLILIFGGFLAAPSEGAQKGAYSRLKAGIGFVVAMVIWISTWIFPVTFMVVMAWGCESHARQLGRRALILYSGQTDSAQVAIEQADSRQDRGHGRRNILRAAALALSVAVPIAIVATVVHFSQNTAAGLMTAIGALVALSLVIAVSATAGRR